METLFSDMTFIRFLLNSFGWLQISSRDKYFGRDGELFTCECSTIDV